MRNFFVLMVFAMFCFVSMVHAETPKVEGLARVASTDLDGTYSGEATPTKMNGIALTNPKLYACDFEISNGILMGDFKVGPHYVSLESKSEITGPGTYPVSGYIKLLGVKNYFSGSVTIIEADGNQLSFTAVVYLRITGFESDFEFTGSK